MDASMKEGSVNVVRLRQELLDVTEDLVTAFPDVPAGSVIRCVARCRDELLAMGVRDGLGIATMAMAGRRLELRSSERALVAVGGGGPRARAGDVR